MRKRRAGELGGGVDRIRQGAIRTNLSYGSSGLGSVFHMMGELSTKTAGVKIKHVPYRGVAPAMQDVIGGHIPMVFISVSNAIPAMQTGRVEDPRRAGADALSKSAAGALDVGNQYRRSRSHPHGSASLGPPGLPQRNRHAPEHRDGQGAQCVRRAWQVSRPTA